MLDSLRARTSIALTFGLLAVLVVGVLIAGWTASRGGADMRAEFEGALVALAATASTLPPEARPGLRKPAATAGLTLRAATPQALVTDVYTEAMAERLRRDLAPLGIAVRAAGHVIPPGESAPGLWGHFGDIVVRVELPDGEVLEFARAGHWSLPGFMLQAMPVVLTVGAGLTLLSVWVARRVSAPLEHFADAAERLGRDVRAPPLEERGPRELRRAAAVLNRTQQRIRRLLDDRTQMLAAIAHDLRTPIMRLYLRAEMLPEPEQQARMQRDLAEMEEMIDAALTLAREETVVEPRETVDLGALLEDLVRERADAGAPVSLHAGEPVLVQGRPGALRRAFANLIDNAVRYGGDAELRWTAHGDRVEVTIDDRGPGIPEAELERVFAPFYRLEPSRSRESGGTGLGLTLARTVVRGHGGDVVLENRPCGGLRQIVRLPLGAAR
ncbi:MAG TPA: ATP-binding protein [Pseudomonadales bacterium]